MKRIDEETPPEEALPLGREIDRFRASARAIALRVLAGPALIVAGVALLVVQLLARSPITEPWWPLAALAVATAIVGVRGVRQFVNIWLLRLHVHDGGFVLRSGDGARAATWEAVIEARMVTQPAGAVALRVTLVHGETLEIAEDIRELRAVESHFRGAVGARFCSGTPRRFQEDD